jgi:GT2 family glycosyltransferase
MERLLLFCQQNNTDYAITCDYDTVFDSQDVCDLVAFMETHPKAGAVWAAQVRRESNLLLVTTEEGGVPTAHKDYALFGNEPFTEARSGHFGLTVIRTKALDAMRHPWFRSVPGRDRRWSREAGKIDADVAFWLRMRNAGWPVYQANDVRIGHMQLVIAWPGPDGKPCHQYSVDYNQFGRPSYARRPVRGKENNDVVAQ